MNNKSKILTKIESQSAIISVIGLGYVGLPLVLNYIKKGYRVLGFDIDQKKIQSLKDGKSYIKHIPDTQIEILRNSKFLATNDFSNISEVDAIIICVPTPLNRYREPDLSFITTTLKNILPYIRKDQIISLESTTYPGTTEEEIVPRIEEIGYIIGDDFFIGFSPEREDPGNKNFHTSNIPKIISGHTKNCLQVMESLYSAIVDKVVRVTSTRVAEMTKLLENIHRAVNIGLVNEMKIVADRMDIDIYEVINAAATKPFGFVAYYPGPGLGGHCIPIDPFYLTWKAREYGVHTRFIELAGEVNSSMPNFVVEKISLALNSHCKSVRGSKILILGVAYKKNIDDVRESPALFIMQKLEKNGADLSYHDPYVPSINLHRLNLLSSELDQKILMQSDCTVLITDHDSFDYQFILENSQLIVDSRGKYLKPNSKVIKT